MVWNAYTQTSWVTQTVKNRVLLNCFISALGTLLGQSDLRTRPNCCIMQNATWLNTPVQVQVKRKGAPDTRYHLMGRAPKHRSELSLFHNTHTQESWWEHRGVSKATDYPHYNKHKKGWAHRRKRKMERFIQKENKRVHNWEKCHLHWSCLFSQVIYSFLHNRPDWNYKCKNI